MKKDTNFLYFLIIWFGDFISTIGSGLTAFCLGVYAFKLTHMATSTAMIVLCTFLPAFLFRPVGGVLADRYSRTTLMILGSVGSAIGITFTLLVLMHNSQHLTLVYVGVMTSSVFFALQNPAYKASVSDFLTEKLYSKASGLLQLSSAAQFLISPLLGGLLLSIMPISVVLIIDVMTFVLSAYAVFFVKFTMPMKKQKSTEYKSTNFISEIVEGIKIISKNRSVLMLVTLISILLFYVGLIQTLLTPMVLSFANVRTLGMAQSICAIGMVITSIIISSVKRKKKNTSILAASLILMGIFFSFIGITKNIWTVIIPGFLFFSMIPFANSSIEVLIRKNTSNDVQGRVWSLISVFTYLGSMVAYAVSGFLADNIFNPLFVSNGTLASILGQIFGVGPGRGIAFIFFLSGIFVVIIGIAVSKLKLIQQLNQDDVLFVENENIFKEA